MRLALLVREALASAWGAKVLSAMSIVMVAGMVLAVILTAGRTVGAQQDVIDTLDEAGTRAVLIRAQAGAGLDASAISRIERLSSVAWIGGFGPAQDGTSLSNEAAGPVPVRSAFGPGLQSLGIPTQVMPDTAYTSSTALRELGIDSASGGITTADGITYGIAGILDVPDHLRFLEPLIVVPGGMEAAPGQAAARSDAVSVIVVVAQQAAQVEMLADLTRPLLDLTDPQLASIETSQQLADLRQLIAVQLEGSGRAIVASIFGLTAVLVAAVLYAFVMMRRRDFGRRRALGATRGAVVSLLLVQTACLAVIGAGLGAATAAVALALDRFPQPPGTYYLGVALLAILVSVAAAGAPATVAARRDPVRELRVP